jgi:peroxin-6
VWTIIPAEEEISDEGRDGGEQLALRISSKSVACASFLRALAALDHHRHGARVPKTVDIKLTKAHPLKIETIYVEIEKGLLEKVDEIQNKFGGGFQQHGKSWKAPSKSQIDEHRSNPQDRLKSLVRDALSHLPVVHAGDVFPLPLPPHPITHARPSPATAIECEPVSQGSVSSQTKIVLIQAGTSHVKAVQKLESSQPIIEESLEDTAEDTSNDQFYSAAEDRSTETVSEAEADLEDEPGTSSDQDQSDEDSDSMEDMISLAAPGLPPQQAGTLSAMTSATPRPGDRRGVQTPGSVYSSFSAATARAGNRPGKVFRTEPLLRKIPKELLHPKPADDDDQDSFIFVDTSTLAKIDCFSGDWVRVEVSKNVTLGSFPAASFNALRGLGTDDDSDWRTVRIFGLPGISDQKARYAVDKTGDRRSSFSHRDAATSLTPRVFLSPILLANMANAPFLKVGALPKPARHDIRHRPPTSKSPPFASNVSLVGVPSPITKRNEMDAAIMSSLKRVFETEKRLIKRGDLLAVPVDQELGSTITSASSTADSTVEELSGKLQALSFGRSNQNAIAWYYVQSLEAEERSERSDIDGANPWGGVAIVDISTVRLNATKASQEGSRVANVSENTDVWTRYWLGMRTVPQQSTYRAEIVATPSALPQLQKLPLETKLQNLITAAVSPRAINLGMPPVAILLHSTQRQVGKVYIANASCAAVGVDTWKISGQDLLSENASTTGGGDVKTEATLKARAELALSCGNRRTAVLLQHIDVLTATRIQTALEEIIKSSRVLIATTSKLDDVPDGVRGLFTHEFEISAPNENAREIILRNACIANSLPLSPSINLKNIALQTAALVAGDLVDVVTRASLARHRRLLDLAESQSCSLSDIIVAGGQATTHLIPADFVGAIAAARSTFSDAIGAPKIPTVTWKDVGGLASQKDSIIETISLPLTHPELFANGVRKRSGILFYGPPGTGKTLLAKAIATEFSLNFFSVKGPELLNMYIGESEANVRRVFQRARDARPCVVFFDELDSVAPKRGNQGDSGGVMDRIVSQLLAELDGMSAGPSSDSDDPSSNASGGSGVFVIGATNRPDLLDPALLRPGRFDKMLYLGVADSHESQVTIIQALTRKFTLAPSVDLMRVANRLPFTYTGADLYALCSDAMLKAITRKTEAVDAKVADISRQRGQEISTGYFFDHLATDEDTAVMVDETDFAAAQNELVGSVSAKELAHFERVRAMFEEQDISKGTEAERKQKAAADTRRRGFGPAMLTRSDTAATVKHIGSNPGDQSPNPPSPKVSNEQQKPPLSPLQFATPPQSQAQRTGNGNGGGNGKGKARQHPVASPTSRVGRRFANPDSGAEDELNMRFLDPEAEISAAGESDWGMSRAGNSGVNGFAAVGAVNGTQEKGKGKGKARADEEYGNGHSNGNSNGNGNGSGGGTALFHSDLGEEEDGVYDS